MKPEFFDKNGRPHESSAEAFLADLNIDADQRHAEFAQRNAEIRAKQYSAMKERAVLRHGLLGWHTRLLGIALLLPGLFGIFFLCNSPWDKAPSFHSKVALCTFFLCVAGVYIINIGFSTSARWFAMDAAYRQLLAKIRFVLQVMFVGVFFAGFLIYMVQKELLPYISSLF